MTALGGRRALLACVVAIAACAERNEAALTTADVQVVEAYVAAMNAGDVVTVTALPAGADHDAVVALAQQVAELSRGAR